MKNLVNAANPMTQLMIGLIVGHLVIGMPVRMALADQFAGSPDSEMVDPGSLTLGIPIYPLSPVATVGEIEYAGEVDLYSFQANAGETYSIETYSGTLDDTVLSAEAGTTVLTDDDSGMGYASKIVLTTPSDLTVVVSVSAYSASQTGKYALDVKPSLYFEPWDTPLPGQISTPGGSQWCAFRVPPGDTVVMATGLDTLADSKLNLYAGDASTLIASNDDIGQDVPEAWQIFGYGYDVTDRASLIELNTACKAHDGTDNYEGLCDWTNPANSVAQTFYLEVVAYSQTDVGDFVLWVQNIDRLPTDLVWLVGWFFLWVAIGAGTTYAATS